MVRNISSTKEWPKTLMIRNHDGGMIWQVYHVKTQSEVDKLSRNAFHNGFYGTTLEDYQPDYDETWPDWRETEGGQKICNN